MAIPDSHERGAEPTGGRLLFAVLCAACTFICVMALASQSSGQGLFLVLTILFDGTQALLVLLPPCLLGLTLSRSVGHLPLRWRVVVSAALGVGFVSLLALCLGVLGLLDRWLWMLIYVFMTVVGVLELRVLVIGTHQAELRADSTGASWRRLWLAACPFLALAVVAACNAPGFIWSEEGFGYDILEYHLALPKEYAEMGRIGFMPHNVYANFPANVEMLYLIAMILFDGGVDLGVTANFIHLFLGALAVAAAWTTGRDRSRQCAHVCGLVMAANGWFCYLGGLAYVENGLLMFAMAATGLTLRAMRLQTSRVSLWLVTGLLMGLASGCKYTGVVMVALPLIVGALLFSELPLQRRLRAAALMAMGALLSMLPWLVKNQVLTGNPVFPLANDVIASAPEGWGDEETDRWKKGHRPPPDADSLTHRIGALWHLVIADRHQRIGPVWLALSLLALRRPRANRLPAWLAGAQLGVWLFATHLFARFAVVLLVPVALLAGAAVVQASEKLRRALVVAVIAGCVWNLAFAARLHLAESPGGAPASLFHEGRVPGYEYLGIINNELPADARILLVGESRYFYFLRDADYCTVFNRDPFATAVQAAERDQDIHNWLLEMRYSHVLVNWSEVRRLSQTYGFPAQINRALFERLASPASGVLAQISMKQSQDASVELFRVLP